MLLVTGCGNALVTDNVVQITLLNHKKEIQNEVREAAKQFSKENPDIKLSVVNYNEVVPYQDKLSYMMKYGNTPTIVILDATQLKVIGEEAASLEDETWREEVSVTLSEVAKMKKMN